MHPEAGMQDNAQLKLQELSPNMKMGTFGPKGPTRGQIIGPRKAARPCALGHLLI